MIILVNLLRIRRWNTVESIKFFAAGQDGVVLLAADGYLRDHCRGRGQEGG